MRSNGIDQWDENYPDLETLRLDIQNRQLFAYYIENVIVGIVVLNSNQDEEYELMDWTNKDLPFLVVHRLAVDPRFQGQGIARKLMDFCEDHCRKIGIKSIRLDTFTKNPRNQKFYENRGYKKLGEVYLKYRDDYPYICYELLL